MNNITVQVLHEAHRNPAGMMTFLGRLTQRGHVITDMEDLLKEYDKSMSVSEGTVRRLAALPHGTIKRFSPITIAIVGASRRFLAQARTHQVGFNYVSASLQYSDYSGTDQFVVPYPVIKSDAERIMSGAVFGEASMRDVYLSSCEASMRTYEYLSTRVGNDTAGYAAPQGLRNILVMQGNHEAWMNFIRLRCCNRNTDETQYVALRIWDALLDTQSGPELFNMAGPDCLYGPCREGDGCCGEPLNSRTPKQLLATKWPYL